MAIYTREQYNALINSISQGVTTVKYGDKEVTYRSLDEMMRIKSAMEADLGISNLQKRKRYVSHTKGLK